MKTQTFISNKYGKKTILYDGQKVECVYYHEYPDKPNEYNDSLIQRLIDKPFEPVKLGIIVGDAGVRHFWLSGSVYGSPSDKEQHLYVKFKEYIFKKAIPISCISDAKESAEGVERFLKKNEHRIGEDGYGLDSYNLLLTRAKKAKRFAKNS